MRLYILTILIFTSCTQRTNENLVDTLNLQEIGQKLNGHWRLKEIEPQHQIDKLNLDKLEHYEFDGLKGINSTTMGSFGVETCPPFCELKEKDNKKFIEYQGLGGKWELEIIKLSQDELTLSSSTSKWTYERAQIKDW